ncbi:uncharacterized protein JCM15063_000880, partial [Sporobolomyces koalae]|uniref:uncharacterized protein n=1 Tax=Sporobolomyces koalae TaxID=500713 RepID=UPI0031783F76
MTAAKENDPLVARRLIDLAQTVRTVYEGLHRKLYAADLEAHRRRISARRLEVTGNTPSGDAQSSNANQAALDAAVGETIDARAFSELDDNDDRSATDIVAAFREMFLKHRQQVDWLKLGKILLAKGRNN